MTIPGLDSWLTSPPEENDILEDADNFLKSIKGKQPKTEEEAFMWSLIEGLRDYINEELGI